MKKLIIIILFALVATASPAQNKFTKPDYEAIKKEVGDTNSSYQYAKLLARYRSDDSTLTNLDYRHLYFGYIFQKNYSPYAVSPYVDSLKVIFGKEQLQPDDTDKLIVLENKILEEQPFNIRDLNTLAFVFHKKGDAKAEEKTARKLSGVIHAILETGDGKTEETAFHVIAVGHEYDMLNVLGLQFGGKQSLTKNNCDYLEVQPNNLNLKGLYFDVSMILSSYSKLFNK